MERKNIFGKSEIMKNMHNAVYLNSHSVSSSIGVSISCIPRVQRKSSMDNTVNSLVLYLNRIYFKT